MPSFNEKNHLFSWQGVNREKIILRGHIEAPTAVLAKARLRQQGIRVDKLNKKIPLLTALTPGSINASEIAIFSRQLATLLNAGIPLSAALTIIVNNSTHKSLQNLLSMLNKDIQTGLKFCDAASKYPHCFNSFYCSLIAIGEATGELANILAKLADYQEKQQQLIRKVKQALFYPTVIFCVALTVAIILLLFVIPQFDALFTAFNAKLPTFTLAVIKLAHGLARHIVLILMGMVVLTLGLIVAKSCSKNFNRLLDGLVVKGPIFGKLMRKAIIARFSVMLATTLVAGMPLLDSLKIVAKTTGNSLYETKILKICDAVSTGNSLHKSIKDSALFPPLAVQLLVIGEETGKLDEMLSKIALIYTQEVDSTLAELSSLIEPLVIVFMGCLVGSLVIAMYLPVFKLGSII